ncbi:MAG: MFS transporter [Bacteroidetes bacterium]|nr:MFS transporter [Bacteroidota bacterium]
MITKEQSTCRESSKRKIFSWTLFDFANTAFYVIILTVGYPLYFKEVVVGSSGYGDFFWGLAFSISMACVAILSPVLGAIADFGTGKKYFLGFFTLQCVIATALLYFVKSNDVLVGMVLLILANIGFEAGLVFYDAFLPEITSERSYGRVSGYGFAMGYAGSLVTLLLAFPLYKNGFVESNLQSVRTSFLLAAIFFLFFALPLFFTVPDKQRVRSFEVNFIRIGFERLNVTFKNFSAYRNVARFLLSYFLYIDGINTIIVFSSIYARETLQFNIGEIVLFFALVQTSAMVGAFTFGIVADHLGRKKTLTITLLLWIVVVGVAFLTIDKVVFYGIGILAGIALGSSQSTSRSLMSELTPEDKRTEFFGFYSFFGKASAILGPLVFGAVSSFMSQRYGILSVGIFLISGILLLQRVKTE